MPLVRVYSRNLGQRLKLARKGTFMKKGTKYLTPPPPYLIPFLSVLHRNKALYNFFKRQQRSIFERNIGLEYTLLVALNSHISTTLSHSFYLTVFFYLLACGNEISNRKKFQKS